MIIKEKNKIFIKNKIMNDKVNGLFEDESDDELSKYSTYINVSREENKKKNISSINEIEEDYNHYSSNIEKTISCYNDNDYKIVDSVTDWYLVIDNINNSFVFPGPIKISEKPILKEYAEFLNEKLQKALQEKMQEVKNKDFREVYLRITLPNIDTLLIFRGNKIKTIEGEFWALRRVRGKVPSLEDLGMAKSLIKVLTNDNLKSGLVLIVGETGNGKSTTCASIIKELCSSRGSFALTVEDPPELPLHGMIGKGICLQTEVRKEGFAEAIRSAMRSYPAVNNSILYVGEIRDAETAKELIKISANGHLVFTTIHGDDIITGLKRLISSASNDDGGLSDDIRIMLASSLRLVVHQKLKTLPPSMSNGKPEKVLKVEFLLSNGASGSVGNALSKNKLDTLNNIILRQRSMLENRGIEELMKEEFYTE